MNYHAFDATMTLQYFRQTLDMGRIVVNVADFASLQLQLTFIFFSFLECAERGVVQCLAELYLLTWAFLCFII